MYIFNSFYLVHSYNPSFLICPCFNMASFRCGVSPPPRPHRPRTLEFHWNRTVVLSQSLGYLWAYPELIHYIL